MVGGASRNEATRPKDFDQREQGERDREDEITQARHMRDPAPAHTINVARSDEARVGQRGFDVPLDALVRCIASADRHERHEPPRQIVEDLRVTARASARRLIPPHQDRRRR
jgi:hypothetical protein